MALSQWEIEQRKREEVKRAKENEAYAQFMNLFERIKAKDSAWKIKHDVEDVLRKFSIVKTVGDVTVEIYTHTRYYRPRSTYESQELHIIGIKTNVAYHQYEKRPWTPNTKGIIKKLLRKANELFDAAKEQARKQKEEEQKRAISKAALKALFPEKYLTVENAWEDSARGDLHYANGGTIELSLNRTKNTLQLRELPELSVEDTKEILSIIERSHPIAANQGDDSDE